MAEIEKLGYCNLIHLAFGGEGEVYTCEKQNVKYIVKIIAVHEDEQINMLKRVNALHHQRSKQSNGYSLHRHAMDDEFVSNGWNVSLQVNTIGDNESSSGSDVQMTVYQPAQSKLIWQRTFRLTQHAKHA